METGYPLMVARMSGLARGGPRGPGRLGSSAAMETGNPLMVARMSGLAGRCLLEVSADADREGVQDAEEGGGEADGGAGCEVLGEGGVQCAVLAVDGDGGAGEGDEGEGPGGGGWSGMRHRKPASE